MDRTLPWTIRRSKTNGKLAALTIGLVVFGWLANTPAGLMGKADAVAYAVCHRIDLRTFYLGSRPLPLCARCTGMYLGCLLGLAYLSVCAPRRGGLPNRWVALALGGLVLAFAVDGFNSFLHLVPGARVIYPAQNGFRLITGTGMGVVMAVFLVPAFRQTVWKTWDRPPVLGGFRHLAGLLAPALALDWLVASENPIVVYPLALLSAGGVLLTLTLLYTMVWILLLGRENRYGGWRELSGPLLAGFCLAMAQIVSIDLLRYWLTGTWGGFYLG